MNYIFIPETHSTNALLWQMMRDEQLPEGFVLRAGFQTAGKGQTGNSWESEKDKNLLFSMVFYPTKIPLDQLFYLSQVVSIGIKDALDPFLEGISVKWPNDIYLGDKKLAGILIENSFMQGKVKTVVGVGLNVNQEVFSSNAPNPVSLKQITRQEHDLNLLLEAIVDRILELYRNGQPNDMRTRYAQSLYRKDGFYPFSAGNKTFEARILSVHPDGQLELETSSGDIKYFYFKEVCFL